MERETNKEGFNEDQKKDDILYMITTGKDRTIRYDAQSVAFGRKTFDVVKDLCIWDPWSRDTALKERNCKNSNPGLTNDAQ
jgi:hypothetical protein